MIDMKSLIISFIIPTYPPGTITEFPSDGRFWANLPGGITHSIAWHHGAYSNVGRGTWKPGSTATVETAWFKDREWMIPPGHSSVDTVQAYQSVDDVLETISEVISEVISAKSA